MARRGDHCRDATQLDEPCRHLDTVKEKQGHF